MRDMINNDNKFTVERWIEKNLKGKMEFSDEEMQEEEMSEKHREQWEGTLW